MQFAAVKPAIYIAKWKFNTVTPILMCLLFFHLKGIIQQK